MAALCLSLSKKLFGLKIYGLIRKHFDALRLRVRKHPGDLWGIRFGDENNAAQLGLCFVRLRSEDVAHLGLATLELAGAGLLEALGRT